MREAALRPEEIAGMARLRGRGCMAAGVVDHHPVKHVKPMSQMIMADKTLIW